MSEVRDEEGLMWSCDESADTLYDWQTAVEFYVDDVFFDDEIDYPKQVKVYAFKQATLDPDFMVDDLLSQTLESLDEEYGSPDDYSDPTRGMIEAAEKFAKTIVSEYHVWLHFRAPEYDEIVDLFADGFIDEKDKEAKRKCYAENHNQ